MNDKYYKLYQCPYDKATKCKLIDPCRSCEEFHKYLSNPPAGKEGELYRSSVDE
jgi:hypothetical protein